MGRMCTVCAHDDRQAIDEAVVSGESYRTVSNRFGVSVAAVGRHAKGHLSPALQVVHAERVEQGAASVYERVEELYDEAKVILQAAKGDGNGRLSLDAIARLESICQLLGRLTGELDERPQVVNVLVSPEWQQVRAVLLAALAPYPEARVAVSGRLLELEAGS